MYFIGIDTGTHTGIAVWSSSERKLVSVETKAIHAAMRDVLRWHREHPGEIFVRFEDARLRNWFGSAGREKLQGAGSIKRDCQIWEDFLTDAQIPFAGVPPRKNLTKIPARSFACITGWRGRCSQHARDAAMLVFGM